MTKRKRWFENFKSLYSSGKSWWLIYSKKLHFTGRIKNRGNTFVIDKIKALFREKGNQFLSSRFIGIDKNSRNVREKNFRKNIFWSGKYSRSLIHVQINLLDLRWRLNTANLVDAMWIKEKKSSFTLKCGKMLHERARKIGKNESIPF